MATIKLTKGFQAIIDDEDYERIKDFNWTAESKDATPDSYYAQSRYLKEGKLTQLSLHRVILNCEEKDNVWFKDGNKLNCQKVNLVKVTYPQLALLRAMANLKERIPNLVEYRIRSNRYVITSKLNYVKITSGPCLSRKEAINTFLAMANEHYKLKLAEEGLTDI